MEIEDENNFAPLKKVIEKKVDEKYFFSERAVAGMMKKRESMNKGRHRILISLVIRWGRIWQRCL